MKYIKNNNSYNTCICVYVCMQQICVDALIVVQKLLLLKLDYVRVFVCVCGVCVKESKKRYCICLCVC